MSLELLKSGVWIRLVRQVRFVAANDIKFGRVCRTMRRWSGGWFIRRSPHVPNLMSNLLYCIFHITSLAIPSKLSGVTSHARSSKQSLNGCYHLPKKSGNLGWSVNGRIEWNEWKFSRENGMFLKDRLKLPNGISEWRMCVPFANFYCFQAFCLGSPLILPSWKKSWLWERVHPLKDMTRPIYYNRRPTGFSEWMVNKGQHKTLRNGTI